jgi:hypothetical protein
MSKKPVYLSLVSVLVLAIVSLLPGCASPSGVEGASSTSELTPVNTEFGRMLGYVPHSFLEEKDICFENQAKAKQIYNLENIDSVEKLMSLSEQYLASEEGPPESIKGFLAGLGGYIPRWRIWQLQPLIGFDGMQVDRLVYAGGLFPGSFSIAEGSFDEELIRSKLVEQGYAAANYGPYSYFGIRADNQMDLASDLGSLVLSSMNRIAILDDTVIIAPATEYVTDVFEAMSGNEGTLMDNPACRALVYSLGDVTSGVILTPDRVLTGGNDSDTPTFYFEIPSDWGSLHQYDLLGMGYRDNGSEQYWDISLYYSDIEAARADGPEMVKRMKSYSFYTWVENSANYQGVPLTSRYTVGEPVVKEYKNGAVLTISCRPVDRILLVSDMTGSRGFRDLLFLVPDPSPYVARP